MPSERPVEELAALAISLYERGIIRREERAHRIAGLALEPGFFGCLAGLPAELIEEVRQIASKPYAHHEDVINGNALYLPMTEEEWSETRRMERVRAYWSARVLHEHFFPGQPLPRFEPLSLVGAVEDATVVDGSVVIFGVENHFYIRLHPVRCIQPTGGRIVTSVIEERFVKCPGDEERDSFRSRFGRYGLFLNANVRSPSEVPPGTEVWVDRSAASDIPPLSGSKPLLLHRPGPGQPDGS
jgi:hypothetical protein